MEVDRFTQKVIAALDIDGNGFVIKSEILQFVN